MNKLKKRQFGHSEKELWRINCVGCPFLCKLGNFCTHKWNTKLNPNKNHKKCNYNACPIRQVVAYEDYESLFEDQNEYQE